MKLILILCSGICTAGAVFAQATEGVLIRCGASSGHAFFFQDEFFNPEGSGWQEDGMSSGKIILVKLGNEWDIQFDDAIGTSGYRQDGARVIPLSGKSEMLTVGAFNSDYVDIYTFDFIGKQVAWSSSKLGPFAPKVAAYAAECE